jgi:hypothetical protein
MGVPGRSVLNGGLQVEGVVGSVVVVVVEVGGEVGVGACEAGPLRGDGDEFDAELGEGAFKGATELAAVGDLVAADEFWPALEAFVDIAFGGTASIR